MRSCVSRINSRSRSIRASLLPEEHGLDWTGPGAIIISNLVRSGAVVGQRGLGRFIQSNKTFCRPNASSSSEGGSGKLVTLTKTVPPYPVSPNLQNRTQADSKALCIGRICFMSTAEQEQKSVNDICRQRGPTSVGAATAFDLDLSWIPRSQPDNVSQARNSRL